jgi:hypothetical protein
VRTGGTGLGLTISRNFARMMQGDLSVQSARGEGQCLHIFVRRQCPRCPSSCPGAPFARSPQTRARSAPAQGAVVDDVPTNRALLDDLLVSGWFRDQDGCKRPRRDCSARQLAARPGTHGFADARHRRPRGDSPPASGRIDCGDDGRHGQRTDRGRNRGPRGRRSTPFVRKPYREAELLETIGELLGVRYSTDATYSVTDASDRRRRSSGNTSRSDGRFAGCSCRSIESGGDSGTRQAPRTTCRRGRHLFSSRRQPRFEFSPSTSATTPWFPRSRRKPCARTRIQNRETDDERSVAQSWQRPRGGRHVGESEAAWQPAR